MNKSEVVWNSVFRWVIGFGYLQPIAYLIIAYGDRQPLGIVLPFSSANTDHSLAHYLALVTYPTSFACALALFFASGAKYRWILYGDAVVSVSFLLIYGISSSSIPPEEYWIRFLGLRLIALFLIGTGKESKPA
jgi:hypothetical protein